MKSYKEIMNETPIEGFLKEISDDELSTLKKVLLNAYKDIHNICSENDVNVMLIGGSLLGAIRHKGFIPWDDDLDLAISRKDFEKMKTFFDEKAKGKYKLVSPNYKGQSINRFPQVLICDTKVVTPATACESFPNEIKIDLFIIENVPENKIHRCLKGIVCNFLMYIASLVQSYECNNPLVEGFMSQTQDGKEYYKRRLRMGKIFSFMKSSKWFDLVDWCVRYGKETSLSGLPTGRKHYFGEIVPTEVLFPVVTGSFEGFASNIPNGFDAYLKNLYGDYMQIPPVEKREKHFICNICFDTKQEEK